MKPSVGQESFSRVLVIEDNEMQRLTLTEMLEEEGFEVIGCGSATEALRELETHRARVAILDLRLPDLTGVQLLNRLGDFGDNVSIIINTAYSSYESARDALNFGAFAYVEKAGEPEELLRHVHRAVAHQLQRRNERLEAAVSANRAHLASVFRAAPIGIGLLRDGVLAEVNDKLCEMTGYCPDELIGHAPHVLYAAPSDCQNLDDAPRDETGTLEIETRWRHKDGSPLNILLRCTLLDPAEPSAGRTFTALDITKSKQAEAKLAESEEHYRSLFENAVLGIYRTTPDGQILAANPALISMLGFDSYEELARRNLEQPGFHTPARPREVFKEAVEGTGEVAGLESEWMRKDGGVLSVRENARVIRDQDGNVICYEGTVEDVTARKRAEEQLQNIFELSVDMVCIADIKTNSFVKVNPAFTRILGYSEAELLEGPFTRFIHPDDIGSSEAIIEEKLRHGERVVNFENRYRCKDGSYRWLSWASQPKPEEGLSYAVARDVTEKKQAEEALLASERRYRAVVEDQTELITRFTADRRITFVNEALCRFYEMGREEMLGRHLAEVMPPEAYEKLDRHLATLTQDHPYVVWQHRIVVPSGRDTCCQWTHRALFDEAGNVTEYQAVARDITEQYHAEVALRNSETRFRELAELLPQTVFELDADGRITFGNRAAFDAFGYEPDDLGGTEMSNLFVSEDRERLRQSFRRKMTAQAFEDHEYTALRRDGSTFPVLTYTAPILKNGQFAGLRGIVLDITERQRSERAIQESKAKLESILESSPNAIFVLAADGMIEDCNQATLEIMGLESKDEILGHHSFEFVTPENLDQAREMLASILRGKPLRDAEILVRRHPDSLFLAQVSASVMVNEADEPLGVVVVATDITEQKRAQERIRTTSDMLNLAPSSITVHDLHGHFLYANRKTFEIHGYDEQEFMAMSLDELDTPESRALIAERMEMIKNRGEASFEVSHFHKDGSAFPLEVYVKKVTWDSAPALLSIATDITERKRAEEALRESERTLSTLMGNLPGMAYRCLDDEQWTMEFVSEGCYDLTGYTSGDLVGNRTVSYGDLIHAEDRRRVRDECTAASATSGRFELEYRLVTADGRERWVWERGRYIPTTCEGPARLEGFVLDISERKEAQEALHQSEYLLRESQKVANIGHYALDVRASTWKCSEVLDGIFGIAPDYPRTVESWQRILHPDDRDATSRYLLDHVIRQHNTFDREYRIIRVSDGQTRWVWGLGRLEMGPDGEPVRMIGVIQDITARKEAEERLLAHQAKLKSLASELSLAEERERRRIAADLHDHACQSLALSKMRLQAMLEQALPMDEDTLAQVCDSLDQIIEGIRELTFDLSSPTLYKFGLEAALEELLRDKLKAEHHIRYRFSDDEQPKPLPADIRILVFQSVRELLINAIKHARATEVRLDIRREANSISIVVADDGVGFDTEAVWSAPSRRHSVGLFNVRERLDHIGGRLDASSEPGVGSQFTLIVPLEENVPMRKENRHADKDSTR